MWIVLYSSYLHSEGKRFIERSIAASGWPTHNKLSNFWSSVRDEVVCVVWACSSAMRWHFREGTKLSWNDRFKVGTHLARLVRIHDKRNGSKNGR